MASVNSKLQTTVARQEEGNNVSEQTPSSRLAQRASVLPKPSRAPPTPADARAKSEAAKQRQSSILRQSGLGFIAGQYGESKVSSPLSPRTSFQLAGNSASARIEVSSADSKHVGPRPDRPPPGRPVSVPSSNALPLGAGPDLPEVEHLVSEPSNYDTIRTMTGDQLVNFVIRMSHHVDLLQPALLGILSTRLDSLGKYGDYMSASSLLKLLRAVQQMPPSFQAGELPAQLSATLLQRIRSADPEMIIALTKEADVPLEFTAELVLLAEQQSTQIMSRLMGYALKMGEQKSARAISDVVRAARFCVPHSRLPLLADDADPEDELVAQIQKSMERLDPEQKKSLGLLERSFQGLKMGIIVANGFVSDKDNELVVCLNSQGGGPNMPAERDNVQFFRKVLAEYFRPNWTEPEHVTTERVFGGGRQNCLEAVTPAYWRFLDTFEVMSNADSLTQRDAESFTKTLRSIAEDPKYAAHKQMPASQQLDWDIRPLNRLPPQARAQELRDLLAPARAEIERRITAQLASPQLDKKLLQTVNSDYWRFLALLDAVTKRPTLTQREAEGLTAPLKMFAENPKHVQHNQRWGGVSNPLAWNLSALSHLSTSDRPGALRQLLEPARVEVEHRIVFRVSENAAQVEQDKRHVAAVHAEAIRPSPKVRRGG